MMQTYTSSSADTLNNFWFEIQNNWDVLIKSAKTSLKKRKIFVTNPEEVVLDSVDISIRTILKNGYEGNSYLPYVLTVIGRMSYQSKGANITRGQYYIYDLDYDKEDTAVEDLRKKIIQGDLFKDLQDFLEEQALIKSTKITPLKIAIFKYYYVLNKSYAELSQLLGYSCTYIGICVNDCRNIIKEKLPQSLRNKYEHI